MKKAAIYFLSLIFLASISSCIKDKFDSPPGGGVDPNLKVNFSIDSLKARYIGVNYQITEDLIISAVVVGDDKSGNLYKQIAIEDSTGGIALLLGGSYLYNNYPVGRRLFIKLKNLYVVNYKGMYQIASYINPDGSFGGIPSANYNQYIFPGKWGIPVVPKVVTIDQLNNSYQSELIELDNVEFNASDMNQPYADGYNQASYARYIKDCNGHSIEIYTSGYADFAKVKTPTGNGKLLALYGVYNTTAQLTLRDTSDVQLYGTTCNGHHTTGGGIAGVRSLYTGAAVVIPSGTSITGIVISDGANGNINSKNMVIQDSTGGILVRFSSSHTFALGDKVTIDLSGDSLYAYKGWLEVTPVPLSSATKVGTGTITPRQATIAQINNNAANWESTLVQVGGATISGTGTYSGNQTLTDASGSATLYTASGASFASTSYPTSAVTVTCILSQYNGVQLVIRNTNDVQ